MKQPALYKVVTDQVHGQYYRIEIYHCKNSGYSGAWFSDSPYRCSGASSSVGLLEDVIADNKANAEIGIAIARERK